MSARRVNGEGSKPFQRPGRKGWYSQVWIADPITGAPQRKLVSAPNQTELSKRVRRVIQDAAEGKTTKTNRSTVTGYAETWIATHLAARDVTPGTRRLYERTIRNHVLPIIGDIRLSKLRTPNLEQVDANLRAAGRSDATRRMVYNVEAMMFDTAVRDRVMATNPADGMDRPADNPTTQPYYSPAQLRKLIKAVEGERTLEQLVPLLVWTGLRVGEALALRWSDVDLDGEYAPVPTLWVRGTLALDGQDRNYRQHWPKGKRPREIPLVDEAVRVLKAARRVQAGDKLAVGGAWADGDLIFTTRLGGLLDPRNLRRRYTPILKRLQLQGSFHALRRSTATMLTAAGVPLNVVAKILGHSTTATTQQRYTIVDPSLTSAAFAELSAYWDAAGQ